MKKPLMLTILCLIGMSLAMAQAEFYKPETSVPENKDEMIGKVETFLNAAFGGDMETVSEMMHEEYFQFPPGAGTDSLDRVKSLEEWKGFNEIWKGASWKGISTCVQDANTGNTIVFVWGRATGTQIKSGKDIAFMNHGVYVFKDDKIFRVYSYYDTATIGEQLGFKMVPADEAKE